MKKKLFIKTYGCQMNVYDSQRIERLLENTYEKTEILSDADLIIINTCSVRKKPEEKLFAIIGSLKPLKQKNKDLIIGVGGCVAQHVGEEVFKRCPFVDFVFGTHNLSKVLEFTNKINEKIELQKEEEKAKESNKENQENKKKKEKKKNQNRLCDVSYKDAWETIDIPAPMKGNLCVSVAISRGCNNRCAYCIVPQTRGSEVSRPKEQIIAEVRESAQNGAKEVLLLGQCVNSYGKDIDENLSFEKLLDEISKIDGIERIRFTSPHPKHITDEFINLVCTNPKICRHVHLPLQAGSNRILSLMNRKYTREHYLELVEKIRSKVPDMAFTTDIIVGFPGETEEEFLETMDMVEKVGYVNSYSFVYSPRPNTEALKLEDKIPSEEKFNWLRRLQDKQYEVSEKILKEFIGKETQVLIDGYSKKDKECYKGINSQNITVNLSNDYSNFKIGDIVNVKIKDTSRLTLRA